MKKNCMKPKNSENLTTSEQSRYDRNNETIAKGQQTFVEVGIALADVRDNRLYRAEFATFEEYCREKWGWNRAYSNLVIDASKVVGALPSNLATIVANEGQARALAEAPEEERPHIIAAVAEAGPVTAKAIKSAVVAAKAPEPDPVKVVDKVGREIPENCLEWWNRTPEVAEWLAMVSKMRSFFAVAFDDGDKLYRECQSATIVSGLNSIFAELKRAKPFAVCPYCQGHPKETKCTFCFGKGLVSEFRWKTAVPIELKAVIEKGIKK